MKRTAISKPATSKAEQRNECTFPPPAYPTSSDTHRSPPPDLAHTCIYSHCTHPLPQSVTGLSLSPDFVSSMLLPFLYSGLRAHSVHFLTWELPQSRSLESTPSGQQKQLLLISHQGQPDMGAKPELQTGTKGEERDIPPLQYQGPATLPGYTLH